MVGVSRNWKTGKCTPNVVFFLLSGDWSTEAATSGRLLSNFIRFFPLITFELLTSFGAHRVFRQSRARIQFYYLNGVLSNTRTV